MPALTFDKSRMKTVDGVEYVAVVCWKCGGTGYLPGYEFSDNARCWGCSGHRGPLAWRSRAEVEKLEDRREKAAARRAAKRAAEDAQRKIEMDAEFNAWAARHVDTIAAVAAYTGTSPMLRDFADQLAHCWTLSDAQLDAAESALEQEASATPVPEGRQEIVGTIVSAKYVDGYGYNAPDVLKAVVDCGTFRVWGTVPNAILDALTDGVTTGADEPLTSRLRGVRVAMTATLQPSDEIGFGFYKRPSKARLAE